MNKMKIQELLFNAETIEDVRKALAAGADINMPDEHGNTMLFFSVLEDNIKMVKFLLQNGVEVNKKNNMGYKPLFYANTPQMAQMLIKAGADEESKKLALELAYQRKDAAMVAAIEGDGRIYASEMQPHIDEVKDKLKTKKRKGMISGTVVADKIAEGIQSGMISETVTPQKGRKLAANIKRKYALNKKQNS